MQKTRARLVDCVPKGEKDALITQEAAAAMGVTHPHLVTTYKYAIKYHEKGAANDEVKIHADGKPLLPGTAECWLFMEMCNKGTLQVCSPFATYPRGCDALLYTCGTYVADLVIFPILSNLEQAAALLQAHVGSSNLPRELAFLPLTLH